MAFYNFVSLTRKLTLNMVLGFSSYPSKISRKVLKGNIVSIDSHVPHFWNIHTLGDDVGNQQSFLTIIFPVNSQLEFSPWETKDISRRSYMRVPLISHTPPCFLSGSTVPIPGKN